MLKLLLPQSLWFSQRWVGHFGWMKFRCTATIRRLSSVWPPQIYRKGGIKNVSCHSGRLVPFIGCVITVVVVVVCVHTNCLVPCNVVGIASLSLSKRQSCLIVNHHQTLQKERAQATRHSQCVEAETQLKCSEQQPCNNYEKWMLSQLNSTLIRS